MAEAGAGQSIGEETNFGLDNMEVMIAVCFDDYGSDRGGDYSTYMQLQYALDHRIPILPIKLCDTWPPNMKDFQKKHIDLDWSMKHKEKWNPKELAKEAKDKLLPLFLYLDPIPFFPHKSDK